jgi:diguanylate cyclase (GGDEF)-like protein
MTGDLAIKDAAKKISLIFSERDFLGRFGGDEFCVLMRFEDGLDKDTVLKIVKSKADDLNRSLKEWYANDEQNVCVSASVGIATYPYSGAEYEQLFAKADQALYDVKQKGKNGYKIAEE